MSKKKKKLNQIGETKYSRTYKIYFKCLKFPHPTLSCACVVNQRKHQFGPKGRNASHANIFSYFSLTFVSCSSTLLYYSYRGFAGYVKNLNGRQLYLNLSAKDQVPGKGHFKAI